MPRSQIVSAVLQTLFITICGLIISHHLYTSAGDKFTSNELFKNFTEALTEATPATPKANNHTVTVGTNVTRVTLPNNNTSTSDSESSESFYWKSLPRDTFIYTIIIILGYFWQIWLERTFPARPRPSGQIVSMERDDDSREEEVVKKWIAQGKIRRASLSWWNTFVKWILDIVVGGLWSRSIYYLLNGLIRAKVTPKVLLKNMKWDVPLVWGISLFGLNSLTSLIAMAVIPAQKRLVFLAAMDLAFCTFVGLFVNLVIPWVAKTEFVRTVLGNMTEAARNATTTPVNAVPRIGDEL